ncbi:hypothetical protein QBC41DRAFT_328998 [Cercophora samala]|uniref:Uncharacterized protein n=1 Tax=Cercophora samala TaxID=330535 RepID=A0AA39Z581_9PEZI|nr:hypothetical protein QBC41DRAFT_328998 [Cercophora samala]
MLEKMSLWMNPGELALVNFSKEDTEANVMEKRLGREDRASNKSTLPTLLDGQQPHWLLCKEASSCQVTETDKEGGW